MILFKHPPSSAPMEVNLHHVVSTVQDKFDAEGLTNKFFRVKPHSFSDAEDRLRLNSSNCILLEFATPHEEFPEVYKSSVYRLLVIFSLYQETEFSPALQYALGRLRYKDNIDRIVLWSTVEVDQNIVQILKDTKVDLIHIGIPTKREITKTKSISYFVPIASSDLIYSLMINIIAERLIKRLRKMFHLVLSEIAAPIYKKHYSMARIATRAFMEFEEDRLNRLIKKLKNQGKNKIAIDVGCGTGRHSFALARHFETVFAYDFSPNMIDEANRIRRENDIRNIFFLVNDFEYEKLVDETQFHGSCDLVVASFGMGSFIEDTSSMLRRFYDWLKPGGYIFISFYNGNSITLNVTPAWRDLTLAARIDRENHSLEVHLTPKTRFNIFCKLFDEGVEGEINRIFNINSVTTYPMIMSVLPNNLLENEFARSSFMLADRTLAEHEESQHGYYVIIAAEKVDRETNGYANVLRILQEHNPEHEIIDHAPVLSIEDVKKAIGYFPKCMIKTILINNRRTDEFMAILLQAEKRLDMDKIAELLGVNRYHIELRQRERDPENWLSA
ncbi:MAG: methyltransferase domain-containing protein, partial [Cyanobacteria bacterium RU_5_0]|nr:methyltransferase domain-containing protein [Cyanobacteria bacterium RU_5_0]